MLGAQLCEPIGVGKVTDGNDKERECMTSCVLNRDSDSNDVRQKCMNGCEPNRDCDSDGVIGTVVEIATLR